VPRKQYSALDVLLEDGGYLSKERFEPLDHIKNFDFWRLFYTAFSRAQNLLVLAAQEKQGRGKSPSKYFERLFYELPSWRDVDLSALTFEAVKQINLKREYSFTSHITVFENCASSTASSRSWSSRPSARARCCSVRWCIRPSRTSTRPCCAARKAPSPSTPSRLVLGQLRHALEEGARLPRALLAAGGAAARAALLRAGKRHWDRIKEAEVEISLVKDQYILKGSVDLIRGEHDTVEIIDFKSEKKPDMEKDRERLRQYQHQLEVYAHLGGGAHWPEGQPDAPVLHRRGWR
jgi:DNA helicase-2/ATP-dependent DNA helicase PcrA